MKVKKVKGGREERQILTAMIVDNLVLSRIASQWKPQRPLFQSKWANLVGGWAVSFFTKYGRAPHNSIEKVFERWARKNKDQETAAMVEDLLSDLSEEYSNKKKELDSKFELDFAEEYFNKVQLKRIASEIESSVEDERPEDAQKVYNSFSKIDLRKNGTIIIGKDLEAVKRAFSKRDSESLVMYRGALGEFFGPYLCKNAFISFIAPDKRGKSFVLLDLACRAWMQGKRVAYFDTGDMTDNQVIRRVGSRCSSKPYRKQKYRYPVSIKRKADAEMASVSFDNRHSKKRLSIKEALRAIEKKQEESNQEWGLYLHCSPAGTCSVSDIRAQLQTWEREDNFQPEVIVIDYADLLAPPSGIPEFRHQINKSWEQMRALSQELDCLLVTATQANAASYKSELMGRWNFSEDKRKLAHVTGMVGINASVKEQDRGIVRLNWIVLREGEFTYSKCVHVASCLAIANPSVRSCW